MRRVDHQAEQDLAGQAGTTAARRPVPALLAAGNQAVARMADAQPRVFAQLWGIGSAVDAVGDAAGEVVQGFTSKQLRGSVGVEGDNIPGDVILVMRLLHGAGYFDTDINAAITRFQGEVVQMPRPDGRVDPGGRTFRALNRAQTAKEPPEAPQAAPQPAPQSAPQAETAPGSVVADPGAIEAELAALAALQHKAKKKTGEETGAERDQLVDRIGEVRKAINGVTDKARKAEFFHRLTEIAPFYTQWANAAYLLPGDKGDVVKSSTCNITTVAMGLELLGLSQSDYSGDRERLATVEQWVEGKTGSQISTDSARLPDFLQLAAIAEKLGNVPAPTDEQLNAARWAALNAWITKGTNALITLFRRFGVKAEDVISPDQAALHKLGSVHRKEILAIADRNERAGHARVLGGDDVNKVGEHEAKVPLEGYKAWVTSEFGPRVDAGLPVCVGMHDHWARLQSFDDEQVVIDDPGGGMRANRAFTWEAARAIGLFWHSVAVKG